MEIAARPAAPDDVGTIVSLYRELESEQAALRPVWPETEGLEDPLEASIGDLFANGRIIVVMGMLDDYPAGFLVAAIENLNERADRRELGVIRYIFTEEGARGVGVGQAMFDLAIEQLRGRGVAVFDAIVSPGHRLAKNFFESQGFKARLIAMNRVER
jgi:GNAT superfamily N-acetyltransferase